MNEFWKNLSEGQRDALIFIPVFTVIVAVLATAWIGLIIAFSSYPG